MKWRIRCRFDNADKWDLSDMDTEMGFDTYEEAVQALLVGKISDRYAQFIERGGKYIIREEVEVDEET